jgi:hypothetical protein
MVALGGLVLTPILTPFMYYTYKFKVCWVFDMELFAQYVVPP